MAPVHARPVGTPLAVVSTVVRAGGEERVEHGGVRCKLGRQRDQDEHERREEGRELGAAAESAF
jgi:hypothetical protein